MKLPESELNQLMKNLGLPRKGKRCNKVTAIVQYRNLECGQDSFIDVINIIKDEHPEWFDESYHNTIQQLCEDAFSAESKLVDWIFVKRTWFLWEICKNWWLVARGPEK